MEIIWILGGLAFLFVSLVTLFNLRARVGELEERLYRLENRPNNRGAEAQSNRPAEKEKVRPDTTPTFPAKEGQVVPPSADSLSGKVVAAVPPALPPTVRPAPGDESQEPERAVPVPLGPSPLLVWLERMGLKPPAPDEEGANPMAWWSTRLGLAFGVIAAVFLGLYVNKNTVPWVRLLELIAVALAVFATGCWFERKLQGFGRALSAGGLALLYVAAYAAYGLPATKVIDSPLLGTIAQTVALVLTIAWALWKEREAIFGLALVLGYVTCSFAAAEGLGSVSLIALMVLALAGTGLFAWRSWWSGLWGAVIGSGLGLAVLATFTYGPDKGPSHWVAQSVILTLTILPLAALSWRWSEGERKAKYGVTLVTVVGLLSGAVVTWTRGFDFQLFYLSFAALLFLAGWWWRRDEGEGLWQTLWAKAMVLLALFLVARFEGPVRAFSLLGQAAGLLWLARTRSRVVFEVGAALAALVGWFLLWSDSSPVAGLNWWDGRGLLLLYLVVVQALLVGYRVLLGEDVVRRVAGVFGATLVALEVLDVACWQNPSSSSIVIPLVFGVIALLQLWPLRLKDAEWTSFLLLIGTLFVLRSRYLAGDAVSSQVLLWLPLAWAFYAWIGRSEKPRHLMGGLAVLVASLFAVGLLTEEAVGGQWFPVVYVGLALGYHVLGSVFHFLSMRGVALLSAGVSIWFLTQSGWIPRFEPTILITLLLALVWWFWGWRNPEEEVALENVADGFRTVTVAVALWAFLVGVFSGVALPVVTLLLSTVILVGWRLLRADSLSWLGLVAAMMALLKLPGQWSHPSFPWVVVLFFVLLAANGVWLARGEGKSPLAQPKVASLLWGSGALVTAMVGLGMSPAVVSGMTASWAVAAVALLVAGFWFGLRGYRLIALGGLAITVVRLFRVDIQDSFWRIVAFGVTGALLVGIGYLYNRFHQRLGDGDLDWGRSGGDEAQKDDGVEKGI
ncbi:DUF2339 domain-containing protein [Roseibacillus persicicus]|uniref:DUF2339 domain-containing protein n=1 Tax=Roseibacillus persicicus TaxID=454148 RepID=UPI00280CC179|nr:DUF2339 domain-containing protein [Roseibacillus persicicus]MDQ8191241.1 DUF2339 domain-containing protein [Roseibacillus persicicus]